MEVKRPEEKKDGKEMTLALIKKREEQKRDSQKDFSSSFLPCQVGQEKEEEEER